MQRHAPVVKHVFVGEGHARHVARSGVQHALGVAGGARRVQLHSWMSERAHLNRKGLAT